MDWNQNNNDDCTDNEQLSTLSGASNNCPSTVTGDFNYEELFAGVTNYDDFYFIDEIPLPSSFDEITLELPSIFGDTQTSNIRLDSGYTSDDNLKWNQHNNDDCTANEQFCSLTGASNNFPSTATGELNNEDLLAGVTNYCDFDFIDSTIDNEPARSANSKILNPIMEETCSSNSSLSAGSTNSHITVNPITKDEENCPGRTSVGFTNSNYIVNPTKKVLEGQNKSYLCSLLSGLHFGQTFKLVHFSSRNPPVMSLDKIVDLEDYFLRVHLVTRLAMSDLKIKKLEKIVLKNKRSLVLCENLIRGLALAEKWAEIKFENLDAKTLNNKFSNFQRPDRKHGAGEKLYRDFIKKNALTEYSSHTEIEDNCNVTFGIFGINGHLKYVSPNASKGMLFFFEDKDQMFLIKNLKGFCRID